MINFQKRLIMIVSKIPAELICSGHFSTHLPILSTASPCHTDRQTAFSAWVNRTFPEMSGLLRLSTGMLNQNL